MDKIIVRHYENNDFLLLLDLIYKTLGLFREALGLGSPFDRKNKTLLCSLFLYPLTLRRVLMSRHGTDWFLNRRLAPSENNW